MTAPFLLYDSYKYHLGQQVASNPTTKAFAIRLVSRERPSAYAVVDTHGKRVFEYV